MSNTRPGLGEVKFKDREDAGKQLARRLEMYREKEPLVLAIPRGGVEIGYQVARHLDAEFSLLIARKLPYPDQPEAGFGAVAEDGSAVILDRASQRVRPRVFRQIVEEQREEIKRRIAVLRKGRPLPAIEGRTVILVDDGIAMGSTMRAAVKFCKQNHPQQIIVAVPVAGSRGKKEIGDLVDDIIVLETPRIFRAVAQVYEKWCDVSDQEVIRIMERWQEEDTAS